MKKFVSLLTVIAFISCSEEQPEQLNSVELNGPIIQICQGYGIFPNQQYDCGWKRGYDDWVFHYNSVVADAGYPDCHKIRVITQSGGTVGIVWTDTSLAQQFIQQTQNLYQGYYNDLAANQTSSTFSQGQFAGYSAGRGQQPYAANNEDVCP